MALAVVAKLPVSEQLVQRHGALRIRADVERKRLAGLKPLDRPSPTQRSSLYSGDMSVRTYQRLAELTECIVQAGKCVIVDATFLRKADRVRFRELADSLNVPFHILVFDADHSVLRKRIAERNAGNSDASDADLDVLESQLVSREHLDADELPSPAKSPTEPQVMPQLNANLGQPIRNQRKRHR